VVLTRSPNSVENQSLRWISLAEVFEGELFGDLPRDGYRSVVKQLATGLDIRLGVEVVSVEVDADGVRAACVDGSVEAGSHVIVAVPLGVLKKGSPKFDPPLPAPMLRAVDALGFGRYEKIVLAFESAFWRDDGISHLIVFPSDEVEPSMWIFDLDAFAAGPVLCAHLFHTITPYALDRPPAQAVVWLRALLAEVFGRPVPERSRRQWRRGRPTPTPAARTRSARLAPTRRCLTRSANRRMVGCCSPASTPATPGPATPTARTPAAFAPVNS
jgi:polyamine oxidase